MWKRGCIIIILHIKEITISERPPFFSIFIQWTQTYQKHLFDFKPRATHLSKPQKYTLWTHKARLQMLCTWAYNYRRVRSSPLHISHGLHFRWLPIAVSDRSHPKNIYVVFNIPSGSGILQCALYISLGFHRLRYAMGSGPEINMCCA